MAAECFVINRADWDQLMMVFGGMCLLITVLFVFSLINQPHLVPTNVVEGREERVHRMAPGPDRWKERSRTFQGIADAMADQWSNVDQLPLMLPLEVANGR